MAKDSQITKVTIAHAVRDVFIASINKGQFPVALLGAVLIIYCIRVSPETLTAHAAAIINSLIGGYLIGYFMGIVAIGGWFLHAKALRRSHHEELGRIAIEKTDLQKKQLGSKVRSSKS